MLRKQVATMEKMDYKKIIPKVDVEEYTDKFILKFELPGVKKEDLKVITLDDTLEIEARADVSQEGENIYSEFESRIYKRIFRLGKDIEKEGIDATFDSGILTVTINRKEESKPVSIEIN